MFYKRRKGMETSIIGYTFLAVVGVALLLIMFSGPIKEGSKALYCSTYRNLVVKLPISGEGKPSLPRGCEVYKETARKVFLTDEDKEVVAKQIAAYIISCYQNSEILEYVNDTTCYHVFLKNPVNGEINESFLTEMIKQEELCNIIANSDYGCGNEDDIRWGVIGDITTSTKFLRIIYNSTDDTIMVKG